MADATTVGQIVGYLRIDRSAWDREIDQAERRARDLSRVNPEVRIGTNVPVVLAQLESVNAAQRRIGNTSRESAFQVHALRDALVLLGPAAVPIAAVASGALLGLVPAAAAAALGIAGIRDEMKSGQLQGTQYGRDIQSVNDFLTQLKQTAASGLLSGVDTAIQKSQPLFGAINQDIGVLSAQLGDIVAGAGPALLQILTALNPLFLTFGQLLTAGARELEGFATGGHGVQSFVAYVQAQLPTVMRFVGDLVQLFSHLLQALAPVGNAAIYGIGALTHALAAIPVDVLRVMIPLLIAGYGALRAYQGSAAIGAVVNTMLASMAERAAANAAAQQAAALQIAAANAEEAAAVAEAAAVEGAAKAAAAEAAARAAAAEAQWGAAYDTTAAEVAAAAATEAAALEASATAAQEAAAQKIAAAREAAAAQEASAEASSLSMVGMLGPVGAVVAGVGILALTLTHSGKAAQEAAQATNTYTQALIQSNGVIDAGIRGKVALALAQSGAVESAKALGISAKDLTSAIIDGGTAFDQLKAKVADAATANDNYTGKTKLGAYYSQQQGVAAEKLNKVLGQQGSAFQSAVDQARAYNEALGNADTQSGALNKQTEAGARLLHTSTDAYTAAQQAAAQNTAQTNQQTLAFQLENNAIGLVNQALQTMAGQNLSVAQAQTALDSATLSALDALKKNSGSLNEQTQAGIADRQAIEGAAQALRSKLQADAQATGSTEKATATYRTNAAALLDQIGKLDGTKSAAYAYAQQLLKIPPVVKTKADLEKDKADAALRALKNQLASIDRVIRITAVITEQNNTNRLGAINYARHADGGTVTGGVPGVDSVPSLLMPGEEVIKASEASKYRGLLKAINRGESPAAVVMSNRSKTSAFAPVAQAQPAADMGALAGRLDAVSDRIDVLGDRIERALSMQVLQAQAAARAGHGKGGR